MTPEEVIPKGYDEEERYFHEQDAELLKKKRTELNAARKAHEQAAHKNQHWMKCPKCGADLEEVEMDHIMVDKCPGCGGIFFDKGELELMLKAHRGLLPRIMDMFS